MIKVNEENVEINGIAPLVATEAAMMMSALNNLDTSMLPLALAAVCTEAGSLPLKEALSKYKSISDIVLKRIEDTYKAKGAV